MVRKPIMAGNWKMNETTSEAVVLSQKISDRYEKTWNDVEVVLCPPSIDLKSVRNVLVFDNSKIKLGAQNVFWEDEGAFTGEISPVMLREVGCEYCIVGHSERREYFGETDETVNRKMKALLKKEILPIVCCGETAEIRDAGKTDEYVCSQVIAGLEGIDARDVARLVIAYEPIWAIGTGHTPTPEAANGVCASIRSAVASEFGPAAAESVRVLYGGSVKPGNVKQYMPQPDIDGALVGGASLSPDDFADLVEGAL